MRCQVASCAGRAAQVALEAAPIRHVVPPGTVCHAKGMPDEVDPAPPRARWASTSRPKPRRDGGRKREACYRTPKAPGLPPGERLLDAMPWLSGAAGSLSTGRHWRSTPRCASSRLHSLMGLPETLETARADGRTATDINTR